MLTEEDIKLMRYAGFALGGILTSATIDTIFADLAGWHVGEELAPFLEGLSERDQALRDLYQIPKNEGKPAPPLRDT